MDDADARQDKKGKGIGFALLAGSAMLAAAAYLPGLLSVLCGVGSGILLPYAFFAACGGKGEGKTSCCWPEDDGVTESPAEPLALSVGVDTPQPAARWRELAARSATAERGR